MGVVCKSCGARAETPYTMLGAPLVCGVCGVRGVPKPLADERPSNTGYALTFADFRRLVEDPWCRPSVAPLLRKWFGYELEPAGEAVLIRARGGEEADAVKVHQLIQDDEAKQASLYRAAMTLWR